MSYTYRPHRPDRNLPDGSGTVEWSARSRADFDVSGEAAPPRPVRRARAPGLIAAAHSSCYAMQLSALIARAGRHAESLDVTADVSFEPDPAGAPHPGHQDHRPGRRVERLDDAGLAEGRRGRQVLLPRQQGLTGTEITLDAALRLNPGLGRPVPPEGSSDFIDAPVRGVGLAAVVAEHRVAQVPSVLRERREHLGDAEPRVDGLLRPAAEWTDPGGCRAGEGPRLDRPPASRPGERAGRPALVGVEPDRAAPCRERPRPRRPPPRRVAQESRILTEPTSRRPDPAGPPRPTRRARSSARSRWLRRTTPSQATWRRSRSTLCSG